jgi:hypothetical protein
VFDFPIRMVVDAAGAVYIAGYTYSNQFPTTEGAWQKEFPAAPRFLSGASMYAGFLAKLSPDGQSLVYGTYVGGLDETFVAALAVDAHGNAFVAGSVAPPGLPVTPGAYMTAPPRDPSSLLPKATGFAVKVNSAGSGIVYSTLLPFIPSAGILDDDGNAYVAAGAGVLKLDASGSTAVFRVDVDAPACYSSIELSSIAVDSERNVLLAGATTCAKLTASEGAFQPTHDPTPPRFGSSFDAYNGYLIKIAADGSGPLFSTFLGGGKYDRITAVAAAPDDSIVVVGSTASSNLPVTPDALQPKYGGGDVAFDPNGDGFIARVSPSGERLLYSSYFGGPSRDWLTAMSMDAAGVAYLAGNSVATRLATPGSAKAPGATTGSDLVVKYANDFRPAPVLGAASPASAEAGSGELTIALSGSDFADNAQALWNGSARPTAFVGGSQLTMTLSAADLALTRGGKVRVLNPGSGVSNPITFSIVAPAGANPTPRVDTIVPTSALAGSAGFEVSIKGSGFSSAVSALWNGSPRPTRFIGGEELRFDVTADDLAQPGAAEIAAEAPAPGGGRSNSASFAITGVIPPNPPTLVSVAPWIVNAGSPATSFHIGAYALTPSAVLRFNGVDHTIYNQGDLNGPAPTSPRRNWPAREWLA